MMNKENFIDEKTILELRETADNGFGAGLSHRCLETLYALWKENAELKQRNELHKCLAVNERLDKMEILVKMVKEETNKSYPSWTPIVEGLAALEEKV